MKHLKIAFIDDRVETRFYLEIILRTLENEYEFDFVGYNSAKEFMDHSKFDEDILFVDYIMPDINGYDLLGMCLPKYKEMPKLVLSTASSSKDFSYELKYFMAKFKVHLLLKPFTKEEVFELVRKLQIEVSNSNNILQLTY